MPGRLWSPTITAARATSSHARIVSGPKVSRANVDGDELRSGERSCRMVRGRRVRQRDGHARDRAADQACTRETGMPGPKALAMVALRTARQGAGRSDRARRGGPQARQFGSAAFCSIQFKQKSKELPWDGLAGRLRKGAQQYLLRDIVTNHDWSLVESIPAHGAIAKENG